MLSSTILDNKKTIGDCLERDGHVNRKKILLGQLLKQRALQR